ncbi:SAM-dependent methyltransferase [Actinoplanes sp. URMC 104]|uniref:SAM-dependent methyltransferase n=1 Tax=Actinoplanes sp. URMC 104 TaxID=3423409 RepID=UPI003F1AC1F8
MDEQPFDTSRPHPARRYDYWLGGKDNFAADRASADLVADAFPTIRLAARHNRAFLRRSVAYLAEQGIEQFLDIGAGLPTADNTHQVAQRINPAARVVYVDNDPIVLAHGRALLTSATDEGTTTIVQGDLRSPATILTDPALRASLDFDKPVGLLMIAVLHFLDPGDQPHALVSRLLDALPAGSWLALTHASADLLPPELAEHSESIIAKSNIPMTLRSRDEIVAFFHTLDIAEPGLVPIHRWRPTEPANQLPTDTDIGVYGAVARKTQ